MTLDYFKDTFNFL